MKVIKLNAKRDFGFVLVSLFIVLLFIFLGCKKEEEAKFTPEFSFEYLDDNYVQFNNLSEGEYYSMIWNFGNGQADTTTDKKKIHVIYYPEAGNYQVSLRLTNYTGGSESVSKTINIANNSLILSFAADIDPINPNYVQLINTTQGDYDSFKWLYRNIEIEDQMEHLAYFPSAGEYEIELLVSVSNKEFSYKQTVNIAQDDPNYLPGLIWSDEFDYSGFPDPSKWNIETGGNGWGNNELQYYTNSQSNVVVENDILTITAKEESVGGRDYTSARITTQNKFAFKYGRIEARIKLPYGQGMWPAFWMLGANVNTVSWPACGEIDIMEMVGGPGNDNTTYATLHWDNDGTHADYGQSYTLPSGILADDYHIFSVEWNSQEIKAFIDDIHYYSVDITPAQLSEFHNNFFIILNVAVGGNWPGSPDETTSFPQTMEIDYVRVFQDSK
jgi:beta-glucanase (GH16 family)